MALMPPAAAAMLRCFIADYAAAAAIACHVAAALMLASLIVSMLSPLQRRHIVASAYVIAAATFYAAMPPFRVCLMPLPPLLCRRCLLPRAQYEKDAASRCCALIFTMLPLLLR